MLTGDGRLPPQALPGNNVLQPLGEAKGSHVDNNKVYHKSFSTVYTMCSSLKINHVGILLHRTVCRVVNRTITISIDINKFILLENSYVNLWVN